MTYRGAGNWKRPDKSAANPDPLSLGAAFTAVKASLTE